ncbi:transglutaminase-like cysteine peptidase [Methylocystis sp. WRRC1]|uniref:transglutaminase-like cysteine peptidase n=1 Tax=unclassified Methylocystis TaxID=2625913 RepID=UPI0001F87BF7|nr:MULTISPECIES: transglutaminase-like cysteine peptidase [unclassified Methylocystis]MCC3245248.1 transglutaminase-like cysteine peptidase [Methylocystis sp. WRRC1]
MFGIIGKAVAALGLAGVALVAVNETSFAGVEAATFAATGAETSVPYGWVDFCQRYRGECQETTHEARDIELTPAAFRKIARINSWVNRNIDPVSDTDHWGAVDAWDYPTDGKGDCEDYALLKRRMLIEAGFPAEALLLTVVKEKNGDGHSVLTIKTNRGEFVLDNLADQVKPWTAAPYRFVKRQSQENPNVWVSIGAPTTAPLYVSNKP